MNANRRVIIRGNNALLTHDAISTTARHTIWLNGADYFTFENLRIEGTNASNAYVVRLSNSADYNIFRNCTISAPNLNRSAQTVTADISQALTTNLINATISNALVAFVGTNNALNTNTNSSFINGRGNLFENNFLTGPPDGSALRGPTYGVFEQGHSNSSAHGENEFINNEIKNFGGIGIFSRSSGGGKYNGNKFTRQLRGPFQSAATSTHRVYGIWLKSPRLNFHSTKDIEVIGNEIVKIEDLDELTAPTYIYGIAITRTNESAGNNTIWTGSNIVRVERNLIADNKVGASATATTYFYGLNAYNAPRTYFANNIISNNVPRTGHTSTFIKYDIYVYESMGCDIINNTVHNEHELANATYQDRSVHIQMATNGQANQANPLNERSVRFENNLIYQNVLVRGNYQTYNPYFMNISSIRNNVFTNKNINGITTNQSEIQYKCRIGANTACQSNITVAQLNDGQQSTDNFISDPKFVDPESYLFIPTNSDLDKAGFNYVSPSYPGGITTDYFGAPRDPSKPKIGAVELSIDFSISGDFNGGNYTICSEDLITLGATINSHIPFDFSTPQLGYILNNNEPVIQDGDNLGKNGSRYIEFDDPISFIGEPSNSVLKIFVAHYDDDNTNDTLYFNINVQQGPTGGELTKSPTSKGMEPEGEREHWITIPDDPIVFNLSRPFAFTNAQYPTDYTVTSSVKTVNGFPVPSSIAVYTHNPSSGGTWTINPTDAYVDSMLEIELKLTNVAAGCDTFIRRQVLVAPYGVPNFLLPISACIGEIVEFENTSSIQTNSGFLKYEWDFGNGMTSEQTNGKMIYTTPGTYTVRLVTTTEPYGFEKSITKSITIGDGPIANFEFINNCFLSPVTITNTTTNAGSGTSYLWDFGNTQSSLDSNPLPLTYSSPRLYSITLTASRNGCSSSVTKEVAQFEQPVADFNVSVGNCQHQAFVFQNLTNNVSGRAGYLWSFGEDDVRSTQLEGHHTYTTSGNKTVKLVVTTALGCVDSITKSINITPGPTANFTITGECQNNDITFTSSDLVPSGQNPVYTWNIDGNTASSSSTNQMFSSVGERQASLTVSYASGCSNTTSQSFEVKPAPEANFTNGLICSGDEVVFKNTTQWTDGFISYEWDFGDGNISDEVHGEHTFNVLSDGNVTVKLIASITDGCSNEISKNVPVNVAPTLCDFEVIQEGENGLRYFLFIPTNGTISGPENGVTYTWYYGDGNQSEDEIGGRNFELDGSYMITMRAERPSGCMCESSQEIMVDLLNTNNINVQNLFNVYPNPNNGKFNIVLQQGTEQGTIEVLDVIGNKIYQNSIENIIKSGNKIDINGASTGIYFVKYNTADKQQIIKIQIIE